MTVSTNSNSTGVTANNAPEQIAVSTTKVLTDGDTIFTVVGDIQIISLISECITTGTPAATTVQWQCVPIVGAAATFTGPTSSLATAIAGSSISVYTGQTLPLSFIASGANNNNSYAISIFCPEGTIKTVVGTGPSTGTWRHYIRYRPLEQGAYVI